MKRSLPNTSIIAALLVLFIISGCASHGKLSWIPRNETNALLTTLLSQTDQYTIHYHGNSEKLVSGILFDPKDDEKTIRPEGALWHAINDADAIASIADTIRRSHYPGYIGRLSKIQDPLGGFYGYLYTGWTYLAIRPVDDQTVRIYGLKGPPEYEDWNPRGF